MNKVILTGRPTKDPEVRYNQEGLAIARMTMAVDRYKEGADFISCNAFGKQGEFCEKYVRKGQKYLVEGRIQTGSYDNKDGNKVYTTDVVIERVEFLEKKNAETKEEKAEDFVNIPSGLEEELPFV